METKVCKCCGRELPIEQFSMRGLGRDTMCKECVNKRRTEKGQERKTIDDLKAQLEAARTLRLQSFTPREMFAELKKRGYEGKLTYTRIETVDLSNF